VAASPQPRPPPHPQLLVLNLSFPRKHPPSGRVDPTSPTLARILRYRWKVQRDRADGAE